jgi:hypothetical protein
MRMRLWPAVAAAPWAVAVGGAVAAWFLPSSRSAIVLNLVAVLAALYLGVRAYRISVLQAEQTARTIVLSRQPLLTAVHEPAGWSSESVKDAWFPAEQPFPVSAGAPEPQAAAARAFSVLVEMTRKGERVDRALVYLRNVGEGPAMITTARLWSGLGLVGGLRGSASVGAGGTEAFTCELRQDPAFSETMTGTATRWAADEQEADVLRAEWQSRKPERLYFLEVSYHDIFGTSTNRPVLRSWFDPCGRGQWRVLGTLAYSTAGSGPGNKGAQG